MVDSELKKLVDNSVQLQKLTISLVESNNKLVKKVDDLISLFEEAAKNVSSGNYEEIVTLNNKINSLIQENKQLARGLVLMEQKFKQGGFRASPIPKSM
jgi:hypothetical protein